MSVILRPPGDLEALNLIPASTSLAVAKTLQKLGFNAKIRWPNDVTVNDSKIAGILCESETQGERLRWIVVGIGLNVNNQPPPLGVTRAYYSAVSMISIAGKGFDLASLSRGLRDSVLNACGILQSGSLAFLREYNSYESLHGRKIRITLDEGILEGIAGRMDSKGRLAIRFDEHTRRFRAEDVHRLDVFE